VTSTSKKPKPDSVHVGTHAGRRTQSVQTTHTSRRIRCVLNTSFHLYDYTFETLNVLGIEPPFTAPSLRLYVCTFEMLNVLGTEPPFTATSLHLYIYTFETLDIQGKEPPFTATRAFAVPSTVPPLHIFHPPILTMWPAHRARRRGGVDRETMPRIERIHSSEGRGGAQDDRMPHIKNIQRLATRIHDPDIHPLDLPHYCLQQRQLRSSHPER